MKTVEWHKRDLAWLSLPVNKDGGCLVRMKATTPTEGFTLTVPTRSQLAQPIGEKDGVRILAWAQYHPGGKTAFVTCSDDEPGVVCSQVPIHIARAAKLNLVTCNQVARPRSHGGFDGVFPPKE